MERKDGFDEFNSVKITNELNYEQNFVRYVNDYENSNSRANLKELEMNNAPSITEHNTKQVTRKHFNLFKLFSSFIVVCAVAAIVQTTFPIPIFSEIFNPTPAPTIVVPSPSYTIDTLSSTYKDVSYSITIDNVDDFTANEYSLLLVKTGSDTDEFIASIPTAVKNANKTIVTTAITAGTFNKCVTTTGAKSLSANTNYVLLVLKDEKIVQSQTILTKDFKYITSVDLKKNSGWVQFTENVNEDFGNYTSLYIEVYDTLTNAYITYAGAAKGSSQYISNTEFATTSSINLKVYCLPTDNTGLEDFETKTIGTDVYYLIYTQNNIDITPYL